MYGWGVVALGAWVALWVVGLVWMWVVGNVGGKKVLCWSGCTLLAQVLGGDQESVGTLRTLRVRQARTWHPVWDKKGGR